MTRPDGQRVFCVAEDRETELPGVCLLIASLLLTNPEARVLLISPIVDSGTKQWLSQLSQVQLLERRIDGATSWNVKAQVLTTALDLGYAEAVWLDADIIVQGDLSPLLDPLDESVFVVAEEALGGLNRNDNGQRAVGWRLAVGRRFPVTLNSCVLRVTNVHRQLLETWHTLLSDPEYLNTQRKSFDERPFHLVGDQDVLTALLSSEAFEAIPLRVLRQGREIVQFYGLHGFTVLDRIAIALGNRPLLIHAQGQKPWRSAAKNVGSRAKVVDWLLSIYQDTSPYIVTAMRIKDRIPGSSSWMRAKTISGRAFVAIGLGSMSLTGFPLALLFEGLWFVKKLRRSDRENLSA